ncbi:uncharacterized protein LOC110445779 [Mizuhopecten yessoensis]|uniref:uncharacterized protein LOC110445779 n=1 Tax=Mizuhopecten yessoensis TaxID=6573 RepID=UPI000B457547|nr:uncharacterized protein LOC110445779 [Mizuhopecten yessoensis]
MLKRKCQDAPPNNKKVATQRYRLSYTENWKCLQPSRKGDTFVHCTVCRSDFSCKHGGSFDCKRHVDTKMHKDLHMLHSKNVSIATFCKTNTTGEDQRTRNVTRAELKMCELIANQNMSLSVADTLPRVFRTMFPDSKIAADMKCARNKTTVLIKEIATLQQGSLAERMKMRPFTISTDGSNDEKSKQYPIVVRTLDTKTGTVNSELLSIPICKGSATGEAIFNMMDTALQERGIPWSQCMALGCDNANVMTGHKKGVFAFVKQKQPHIFLAGCTLHLVHIAAKKAAAAALPPVDDILVDIYYFFHKSDKRRSAFKGTQALYDLEQKKMLKHVCTRWLSIGRCVDRMLLNWDALKDFFKEQKDAVELTKSKKAAAVAAKKSKISSCPKNSTEESSAPGYAEQKIEAIYSFVRSPTNRLYVLFLQYTIHVYDDILLNLQSDEPKIHILQRSLQKLLRNILTRFIKPAAMLSIAVDKVQYKQNCNIKPNTSLVIGEEAKNFIENAEVNHLRSRKVEEFYKSVVRYFHEVCDYICSKLPLNDPVLSAAQVADVNLQTIAKSSDLRFFIERYSCIIPPATTKDKLLEQFTLYQCTNVSSCTNEQTRMDSIWSMIGKMRDEEGKLMFSELSVVMCGILTIPHSSAHCKRVFSCVRKNRTEQRACLGDSTLESLLVIKSSGTPQDYTDKELDHIRGSYYRSLKSS